MTTRKQYAIGYKLLLFTNRKPLTDFLSVPTLVTFSDLEQPSGRYYALVHIKWQLLQTTASNSLKRDQYCQQLQCGPGSLGDIQFMRDDALCVRQRAFLVYNRILFMRPF